MVFNINDFKAKGLINGGARPSQFEVNIFVPFSNADERLRFLCRAASSPPSIMDDVPVFYFGRAIKMAGDRTFPDWEITVMNDEDFALRRMFENWSNKINALVGNRMSQDVYPTGYKVDGTVKQYGKSGAVIAQYDFQGLWPKVVDGMPLDWAQQNQIQEFNVTLAYDVWVPGDIGTSATISDAYDPDGAINT